MTNADRGGAVMEELSQRIQRAYGWDSLADPAPRGYDPPPDYKVIDLPAEVLREYVGEYQVADTTVAIRFENGALLAGPAGQPPAPLLAMAKDHFFLRVAPVEVLFTRDDAGLVNGLTVVQQGQRTHAAKLR
jgi:hypothetical protein